MAFLRSRRSQVLVFLIMALLLAFTACTSKSDNSANSGISTKNTANATNGNGNANNPIKTNGSTNSVNNGKSTPNATQTINSAANTPLTVIVGGKQDTESQLLTKMYVLLLRHAGLNVVEQASAGNNDVLLNTMINGRVDLVPAFTATGLSKLGLNSTGIAHLDYLQMKQGYEAKYHVTWLDPAPLNAKIYNSAPLVRDSILKKAPQIATTLNKLAPLLTTQASQQMQSAVTQDGKSVTVVATQFLQSKGLL